MRKKTSRHNAQIEHLRWEINRTNNLPLYQQVKELLYNKILKGEWVVGSSIPPERALCEALNISRITINRALRDLSEEGVLKRIQGKGTFVARAESQGKNSRTIGIVIHKKELFVDSFFDDIMRGIDEAATKLGYQTMILPFDIDLPGVAEDTFCIRNIFEKNLEGMIIFPEEITLKEIIHLKRQKIPFVSVNNRIKGDDDHDYIIVNWRDGVYQLISHLVERGYREIGYLGGWISKFESDKEKFVGFRAALEEFGLPYHPEWVWECPYTERERIPFLAEELLTLTRKPRAIVCGDDNIAAQLIRVCLQRNIAVPDELAVAGFNNQKIATSFYPGITTVGVSRYEMGKEAMHTYWEIVNVKEGEIRKPVQKVFQPYLFIREST